MKRRASDAMEARKRRAAGQLGGVVQFIRRVVSELDEQGHSVSAEYGRQAAARLERLSERIETADLDEARRAVEAFARRQPGLFVGAALGAGVIAGRILIDVVGEGIDVGLDDVGQSATQAALDIPERITHGLSAVVRSRPLLIGLAACAAGMTLGLALAPSPPRPPLNARLTA